MKNEKLTSKTYKFKTKKEALAFINEDKELRELNDLGKDAEPRWEVQTYRWKYRPGTKAAQAREIVEKMADARPKDVIAELMKTLGFKKPAATTYYYNAKKQIEQ